MEDSAWHKAQRLPVLAGLKDVTSEWLGPVFVNASGIRVETIDKNERGAASECAHVEVTYCDGEGRNHREFLFVKRDIASLREGKGRDSRMYLREVSAYTTLLPLLHQAKEASTASLVPLVPPLKAYGWNPETLQFVLLFTDISQPPWNARVPRSLQELTDAEISAAVRSLATIHGAFWDHETLQEGRSPLPRLEETDLAMYDIDGVVTALLCAKEEGETPPPLALGDEHLLRLRRAYPGIRAALKDLSRPTLLHGDVHEGNIAFASREALEGKPAAILFDWQHCMRGCPLFDLALLFANIQSAPRRRFLVDEFVGKGKYHALLQGTRNSVNGKYWRSQTLLQKHSPKPTLTRESCRQSFALACAVAVCWRGFCYAHFRFTSFRPEVEVKFSAACDLLRTQEETCCALRALMEGSADC